MRVYGHLFYSGQDLEYTISSIPMNWGRGSSRLSLPRYRLTLGVL